VRAYRIAYDGTAFRGFQRQPDVPTVEDALFDALAALGIHDDGRTSDRSRPAPPGYAAAGRTDAGVSALAQTVAFEAPDWCCPRALNAELPPAIRAWAGADAPDRFHATRDARSRTYAYHLHAPEGTPERARAALDALAGRHDFAALTPDDRAERTLSTDLRVDGPYLVCRFRAGGFPRAFVRRAVSLVAAVARDDRPLADVDRLLSGPATVADHKRPGAAPPEPLVLEGVDYGLDFEPDPRAARSARDVFGTLRTERRTAARVAAAVAGGVPAPDRTTDADHDADGDGDNDGAG